jgi:hypothetical protein
MKIRTLIAQCAAAGAITAGSLTLTAGTAHAAINCNNLSNQISTMQRAFDADLAAMGAARDNGDDIAYSIFSDVASADLASLTSYRQQFRVQHCA